MTRNPATVEADSPVSEAARLMKSNDAGAIIVLDNGRVSGIITDRDVAIRVVAEGKDSTTPVREACSAGDMTVVGPDTSVDQAVQLMRTNAIRRLPVVENDRPVGILSIGDLAMEKDEQSALADISAAPGDQ
jgi:CBS domain-containing protein